MRKEVQPPFVPQILHPADVAYFDSDFTKSAVSYSPNDLYAASNDSAYPNFTYQAADASEDLS